MKNLAILVFLVIGITSCSKDSLDPGQDQNYTIVKSEIMVTATYISYNQVQCGNGCGNGDQTVSPVVNASLTVYPGEIKDIDEAPSPVIQGRTDNTGKLLIKDLDPGLYSVFIQSNSGNKSRVLYTQLSKRSYIEFSF